MLDFLKRRYPLYFRFLPYLRPDAVSISVCIFLNLAAAILGILVLSSISRLIDDVFIARYTPLLTKYLIRYGVIISSIAIVEYALARIDAFITEKIQLRLREDLFRHVISISPGSLSTRGPGEIISHLASDASRAEYLVYSGPLSVGMNIVRLAAYGVFLFTLNWQLTLCALATTPFLALSSGLMSRPIRRAGRSSRRFSVWRSALATERLGAANLIQTYCSWDQEAEAFRQASDRTMRADLRGVSLQATLGLLTEGVGAVASVLLLAVGALQVSRGDTTVGAFVAFVGSVGSLYSPAKSLARSAGKFHRAAAGARRFAEILDTPSRVKSGRRKHFDAPASGALAFEGVTFGYAPEKTVLRDFTLQIDPGEKVALVGASGCGKSTVTRLLMRFYDPQIGCVRMNGVDIKELDLNLLRASINLVSQDAPLLNMSVMANMTYGQSRPSEHVAWQAIEKAGAGFVEDMPGRLYAWVGPNGERLSGGQKQRIALARALMRKSPVMILDEATGAIDSEGEAHFQDALTDTSGDQTLIIIAHRLSSIQNADRIVFLDAGQIVESGPPDRLLTSDSQCRRLFAAQLEQDMSAA